MVSKLFVLVLIIGTASAATWIRRQPTKPKEFEGKEGCYIEEIKDVVPYGTTLTPLGYCYRIGCSSDVIDYASCGTVSTSDSKCYVTDEDLSKPYPDCCPTIKCDLDNKLI